MTVKTKSLKRLQKYYTTYMIKSTNSINKSFSAFLFYDPSVKTNKDNGVFYVKYEGNDWKLAETEDKKDIQLYVNEQTKGEQSAKSTFIKYLDLCRMEKQM